MRAQIHVAHQLRNEGRSDDASAMALSLCEEARVLYRAVGPIPDFPNPIPISRLPEHLRRVNFASHLAQCCYLLLDAERYVEAEPYLRECVALRDRLLPPENWRIHSARSLLGEALAGLGRHEEADPLLVESFEKMFPFSAHRIRKHEALARVIRHYEAWGKPEKAAEYRAREGGLEAEMDAHDAKVRAERDAKRAARHQAPQEKETTETKRE